MVLAPMRYKDYVWPHNPETYRITYERAAVVHKVPFGRYYLQDLGMGCRVMTGEGVFCGEDAYEQFKKLATVFYQDGPGLLVHPVWMSTKALFTGLSLAQEPRRDFVRYTFEFREDVALYRDAAQIVEPAPQVQQGSEMTAGAPSEQWYTVVRGDTLWAIARRHDLSLQQLLALNPGIKNPNLIFVGDEVRVR